MWLFANIKTLGDIPRYYARRTPDKRALADSGTTLTFSQLDRSSNRIAQALLLTLGDTAQPVGFLGKNSARYFELLFGASKSGHPLAALNWRLAAPELAQVIADSTATLVFHDREFAPLVAAARAHLPETCHFIAIDSAAGESNAFDSWLGQADDSDPQLDIDPRRTALLLYTSGTTGKPKGVQLSHQGFERMRLCEHFEPALQWTADDVMLTVMPNFHLVGTGLSLQALYNGSTLSMLPALEPGALLAMIARDRPSVCALVPTVLQMLLDHPQCAATDLSSLRLVMYAGSPIAAPLLRRALHELGCPLMQFYGATETGGAVTLLRPEQHDLADEHKLKSCGTPLPLIDIRIVDAQNHDITDHRIGEILIRSPGQASGYWGNPQASAESFVDGWYRSGDVGYRDSDGLLYIVDRAKDMIVSGGENVYSTEVEVALLSHPAVQQCAVIGIPDTKWGERVVAVVVVKNGADFDEAALIAHCRGLIAGYKLPKQVHRSDALPLSPSGKILKRVLREQICGH